MVRNQNLQNLICEFIHTQVISRGLDEHTAKAYQLDLELFFRWTEAEREDNCGDVSLNTHILKDGCKGSMEAYLKYLSDEKGLRFSTICRRHLVFGYFLSYMKTKGIIEEFQSLKLPIKPQIASVDTFLTKAEIDAFFQAISQEYTELDSDFRRRVCLRDQIMMKLLFYHRIEISELLRMEVSDYNRRTAVLVIHRKREKERSVYLFSRVLQKQMEQWLSEHMYFEHGDLYHSRMFLSKLGRPLSMKMVTNIFDKYRVMAGIDKECTPKDLKNSLGRYAEEVIRERG